MANEIVHVHLGEHNPHSKSPEIMNEVLAAIDEDTQLVIFYMENSAADNDFYSALEDANSGKCTYYDGLARAMGLLPSNEFISRYPLIKSISSSKYAKLMLDLGILSDTLNGDGTVNWSIFDDTRNSDPGYLSEAFLMARAYDLDKLKRALQMRGKSLEVVTEPISYLRTLSQEFLKKIMETQSEVKDSLNNNDIDRALHLMSSFEVSLIILGMARDEENAKHLLEILKKKTGKVEVFSHFGTLHKYLSESLEKYGFRVITSQQPLLPHQEGIYNVVHKFVTDRKISFKELIDNPEGIQEIVRTVESKFTFELLVEMVVSKQVEVEGLGLDLNEMRRRFFKIYYDVVDLSPEERIKKVKLLLQDML